MSQDVTRRDALRWGLSGLGVAAASGWLWQAAPAAAAIGAEVTEPDCPQVLDTVVFGDSGSELRHRVAGQGSDVVSGGLGQSARILQPTEPAGVWGGSVSFRARCAPGGTTYVTVKLWGEDKVPTIDESQRLILFVNGEQVGHHHQGAVDCLDIISEEARTPGRFFLHTLPLPESHTSGRTEVELEIRALGRIWPYGQTRDAFYRPLTKPTRGIYRVYTHTEPYFVPRADDPQGESPVPSQRTAPGEERLAEIEARVVGDHRKWLNQAAPVDPWGYQSLAEGYFWPKSPCHGNPAAIERALTSVDAQYVAWLADPKVLTDSPQQWEGFGKLGLVLVMLWDHFGDRLSVAVKGRTETRREAYTRMLVESRDYWRQHNRHYTNQCMICALGIYRCNRGLSLLAPELALPEAKARDYIHQSIGLKPYLGPEDAQGVPTKPLGENYFQRTSGYLTKELGYVGNYGEVTDWLVLLYESIIRWNGPTAPEVREHIVKMTKARACFRFPAVDGDGCRAMRGETVVGWRDDHYPSEVIYAQRMTWDGNQVMAASVLADPTLTGYTRQMLADNQFFANVGLLLTNSSPRVGLNALRLVQRDWPAFQTLPDTGVRLPMGWDEPDFVFTDEEDGVLAVKNGREILYVSLYWRARQAVNNFARIHLIRPGLERSATIRQESRTAPTGKEWVEPNWVSMSYAINDPVNVTVPPGGFSPPGPALRQAFAGERMTLAAPPVDVPDPRLGVHVEGVETLFVGRADFYRCQYGDYLIGMNTHATRPATLLVGGFGKARNLATGESQSGHRVVVPPRGTVVLHRD